MPKRNLTQLGKEYRYLINGQEQSKELNVNLYNSRYWEYDSRVGKRWNLDPKPTLGLSEYSTFVNNPIWHSDFLGDSIAPNRNIGFKVFVVGKTRDKGSELSYRRFKKAQEKDPTRSILIETDNLDKSTINEITKKLGNDGFIKTLALDFHRTDYDNMTQSDEFFSGLSNGYTGNKTDVFLGMCWAGGGLTSSRKTGHL